MERYKTKFQENVDGNNKEVIITKCINNINPAITVIKYDEHENGIVVHVKLDYKQNSNEEYTGRGWGTSLQIDLEECPEFNSKFVVEDTRSSPEGEILYIYEKYNM